MNTGLVPLCCWEAANSSDVRIVAPKRCWQHTLSDQRGRDLVNIPMTPLSAWGSYMYNTKNQVCSRGSRGFTRLQKSRRKLVQRKQRSVASDNTYNYHCFRFYQWQIITSEPNQRATPNLQRTVRWMCTIDGKSHPLPQLYNLRASTSENG